MHLTEGSLPFFDTVLAQGLESPGEGRQRIETEVLPAYVPRCRWFGGKARKPQRFELRDVIPLGEARAAFVRVAYADGSAEEYQLHLAAAPASEAEALPPEALLASGGAGILFDALYSEATRAALFRAMLEGAAFSGAGGVLKGVRGEALESPAGAIESRLLKVEQSNSSIVYGDRIFLKLYRKLEAGLNPDAEITRFLSERSDFQNVPPFAGVLEYHAAKGGVQMLGLALGLVPNRGDAWSWALSQARDYFARAASFPAQAPAPVGLFEAAGESDPFTGAEFVARARQLGVRTGELHLALAGDAGDPAFAPEPFTNADVRQLAGAIRDSATKLFAALDEDAGAAESLRRCEPRIGSYAAELEALEVNVVKTRAHGDYHLGQVLETGGDFVIIDFEGEPLRPLSERRKKRSPLRDVAGMLRSFHYAAHASLVDRADRAALEPWAEYWSQVGSRAFLGGWLETAKGAEFLPGSREQLARLLNGFLLEKALYEVSYEINNRPSWLPIPLRGLQRVLGVA